MGEVQLRQIKKHLEKHFLGKIALDDLILADEANRESHFLTRSLSAFALSTLSGLSTDGSGHAVVDGADDNGIDAIHLDPTTKTLYLVQSKWISSGKGTISLGDLEKFLVGVQDILSPRLEKFNDKVRGREPLILQALEDASTTVCLIIAHTGTNELAPQLSKRLSEATREHNDASNFMTCKVMNQKDFHEAVADHQRGAPVNAHLTLFQWGSIEEPYRAVYGQIEASDIADLAQAYSSKLFTKNIRKFIGSTSVNEAMEKTLKRAPTDFWYFNNGITAICKSVKKTPAGGKRRESGTFECKDLTIVNGAQTVGCVAAVANLNAKLLENARVMIRIISLENCPEGFDVEITKATNTQNRIEYRDFAALDPQQDRLKEELAIDGIRYVVKRGESAPESIGCSLEEATIALACALDDISIAVQAKRGVGSLWESIDSEPYTKIFHPGLSGVRLWNAVRVHRAVEKSLLELKDRFSARQHLITIHGNRFILHRVFQALGPKALDRPDLENHLDKQASRETEMVALELVGLMDSEFTSAYPAPFFKNAVKCRELSVRMSALTSQRAEKNDAAPVEQAALSNKSQKRLFDY